MGERPYFLRLNSVSKGASAMWIRIGTPSRRARARPLRANSAPKACKSNEARRRGVISGAFFQRRINVSVYVKAAATFLLSGAGK